MEQMELEKGLPPDLQPGNSRQMQLELLGAAVIGVGAALTAFAFRLASKGLHYFFTGHTSSFALTSQLLQPSVRLVVPAIGGLLAGLVLYFGNRLHRGQPAKDYMEAIAVGDGTIPMRSALVKCFSSLFSISTPRGADSPG